MQKNITLKEAQNYNWNWINFNKFKDKFKYSWKNHLFLIPLSPNIKKSFLIDNKQLMFMTVLSQISFRIRLKGCSSSFHEKGLLSLVSPSYKDHNTVLGMYHYLICLWGDVDGVWLLGELRIKMCFN